MLTWVGAWYDSSVLWKGVRPLLLLATSALSAATSPLL